MAYTISIASIIAAASLAAATQTYPAPHTHARRFVGYSGIGAGYGFAGYPYSGYGYGFGFPFASSFTNAFNANNNFAHFNDDTLYVNDKDATFANSNLNNFNNANVIG